MAEPKTRRIANAKIVNRFTVRIESGEEIEARTYLVRPDAYTSYFRCICDLLDIDKSTAHGYSDSDKEPKDIADLEKLVEKLIIERSALEWKPYLYISVNGGPDLRKKGKDGELEEERHIEMDLRVDVKCVELAEGAGKKRHRFPDRYRGRLSVHDGWPETGLEQKQHWGGNNRTTYSMVPDTPENRRAVYALRSGMRDLLTRLEVILSPARVQKSLASASMLMLAADIEEA